MFSTKYNRNLGMSAVAVWDRTQPSPHQNTAVATSIRASTAAARAAAPTTTATTNVMAISEYSTVSSPLSSFRNFLSMKFTPTTFRSALISFHGKINILQTCAERSIHNAFQDAETAYLRGYDSWLKARPQRSEISFLSRSFDHNSGQLLLEKTIRATYGDRGPYRLS